MFKYGIVSEVKQGFVKVHFEEDNIVTDWLPVIVRKSKSDKESWQLEINEHIVCLMDDHCETGVVIGAIPNNQDIPDQEESAGKFRKKFSDGTTIEYDKNSGKLIVDVQGEIIAKASNKASIEAPNIQAKADISIIIEAVSIELKGDVIVTGSLTAASIAASGGGGISTAGEISGGSVKGGGIDLAGHTHGGVKSGEDSTGPAQ